MKVAALDLGSNTFLCLIADVDKGRITQIYDDQVRMVRLGQGVAASGVLHPEALERADKALSEFSEIIKKHKPEKILAMATSAARDARNKDELFALGTKYQIPIEIIPGGREAEITFSGAVSGLSGGDSDKFLVVDIGGGSTEFIFGSGSDILGQSLDIGAVRLRERWQHGISLGEAESQTAAEFKKLNVKSDGSAFQMIAVAGTPTELARIEVGGDFDPQKIDGYRFDLPKLHDWIMKLFPLSGEGIQKRYGVHPGRADVLVYGLLILAESLRHFKCDHLTVSVRGVRYGVALEIERRARLAGG